MKKRILSILLTLCMMLCLTPISVFAEEVGTEGSAAIQLGADALSVLSKNVNTATAPTVYFGQNHENNPAAWRVIGYDGSGVTSSKGDITLLAAGAMGVIPFVDTILNNEYAPSNLKTAIDALAEKLTTEENPAVKKRTLTSGSYDGENTDCVAGGQVDNAVFWPLSAKEAIAVNNDLRALNPAHPNWVDSGWWLRSPGSDKYRLAVVRSEGSVQYSGFSVLIFNNYRTVRPAFNLNLNSVLFASAAVGGKPDGGLAEVSKYSGNEWKLTLLDSRRNFAVTEKTVSAAPDDTVTLNYKGATRGKNEYISVILADNNGAQYYGRVAQPTAKSGTVEIKIPSDIAPGDYTMKVFSEQYNGDCKTDLASAFADVTLTVESQPDEQFTLAPGGRYYFDLSAMNISGTVNSNLPDSTLHYVPFTYAGTVNAYKLTSEMATTEEYAQKNKYPHSLFIADYAVTHTVSWDDLNTAGLIFGKNYASGGVDYTLRAPSVGSDNRGSGDSERGTPQSNEWDRILDKDSGYIKNWNGIFSWGQDTTRYNSSLRAIRGYDSGRRWNDDDATDFLPLVGFRPVLEVLNPDTLSSDGLKVVTLDLGGGTLGGSSDAIQIIVKNGSDFTAPASDGMTRPDGNTGSYFMWRGSNGKLYAPGASVPADVTKLTAQFVLSEQFSLTPGGRYYFDLSAMNISGTVNSNLPDSTLHYVPFTYVGTVGAYSLKNEADKDTTPYEHSLFIANYNVTHTVSWNDLNTAGLLFGKDYASGGVDYTLRAPSVGSDHIGGGDIERGTPQSNEWDAVLDKNSGYIKNWNGIYSWGQDTTRYNSSHRAVRGYSSARFWLYLTATNSGPYVGFRPVLEILNPNTLSSDGLKVVTLDLGGGTLGNSSEDIQIIVKNGSEFTAPASDGLTRPDGDTDNYFMWLDGNGNSYEPGGSVPADVTELTVQWTAPTYAVTLNTNGGTINNGNVTGYTYGVGATLPAADDMTYTGHTFKGWYDNENLTGSPVTAIGGAETGNKEYWAKWEINQYTVTVKPENGKADIIITQDYGTPITAPTLTREGYTFKGWDKEIPKTMPAENITVKAQWEINQYTITFDTNGGSEIAPITQDYGTEITAPDNPTRKGYTFKGWDKKIPKTMPAENITVKAQWEINQYTITFDTNGGSEIEPITQDYGTEITVPDNPTRKGYTFKGWDREIPETMPAENITVKAQWEINQYTIAFDTNGGSEIAPITQDYGTEITAPDNPTRKGYTFKGWDKEIPETMPAENITVKAQWEINQYTITFDTNGGSEIAPITQDYGTEITAPDNPTRKGYTFKGWDKEIPETMPAENITITARWKDTEKPTGEIIIGTNKWNEFLNKLTFGIFFKNTQEVTINAVDNSGVVFVSYLVTDKELSEAELNSLVFRAYEEPFSIDPNGEYIVYVMLVDENINITYLRSDRITLDNIQPVISGIENGKTYCEAQTVTVDEKYVDTVTVNGTAVTLDADGGFVLPPTNGEQKIVVTDKAGNNAEMTVTVNNGHTFGEWVSDNNGKHTRKCTVDGCDAFETENCSGGNATCTEKAVCDVCGKAYGEFDGTNHEGGVQEWTTRTAFNHEQKWNCCGAVIVASEAHEWKDGVCRECGYVCLHNDADKDHICDYCKKTISEHVDKDKNHICDYCEKTISAREDAPTEEIKKANTVTAKLPDDSKSPQTGDNSNLILWIALLIISGGVMKGVTAFGKSKKHSAKIKDK
ncbi:MAG: InlB B-repeat-containing protein [Ruminococcus sp.]